MALSLGRCSARLQAGICLHIQCRPEGRRYSITTSRSLASTLSPTFTSFFVTLPSIGAYTVDCIFIASRTRSRSPFLTCCPTSTATLEIAPGMGAPTCPGSPASAFGRACTVARKALSRMVTSRGCPFNSKKIFRVHQIAHQVGMRNLLFRLFLDGRHRLLEIHGCKMVRRPSGHRLGAAQNYGLKPLRPAALGLAERPREHFHHGIWQSQVVIRPQPLQVLHTHIVADEEDRQIAHNFARRRHLYDVSAREVHFRIRASDFMPARPQPHRLGLFP